MNQINSPQGLRHIRGIGQMIGEHIDREAEKRAAQITEEEFVRKSAEVFDCLEKELCQGEREFDEDAQLTLAKATSLIIDIEVTDIRWLRRNPRLLDAVHESVKAILKEPSQIKYAKCVQQDVHRRLHPWPSKGLYESFKRSIKSSPGAVVVCGLFVVLVFLISLPLLFEGFTLDAETVGNVLNVGPKTLLLIAAVGALGSIVSIMIRIRRDFAAYTRGEDPWPFFFFALFKPIVGAAFALFAFAAIHASLVPISSPKSESEGWFFVAIAFLAGFSERFAGDIVSSTEMSLSGSSTSPPNEVREAEHTAAKGGGHKDKDSNPLQKRNGTKPKP